jgi:hypothetical protein
LLAICFAPSLADLFIFLTLTRLVVVIIFENFSFALFTPPLGDFHLWLLSLFEDESTELPLDRLLFGDLGHLVPFVRCFEDVPNFFGCL